MNEITEDYINSLSVSLMDIKNRIAAELGITTGQVSTTVDLLKDGNTIPFISRYRKEATGSLDEVQVRDVSHRLTYLENLEQRRIEIVKIIFDQGKLVPELLKNINKAMTQVELEDLYAPYKKKKKTRGMLAMEKGLEELAELILTADDDTVETEAERFVDEEKGVANADEAIQGAMDIIAERVAHDLDNRKFIKEYMTKNAVLKCAGQKDEESSVYKMYYDYNEPVSTLKPHRVLAINRGEKEGELEVKIDFDEDECVKLFSQRFDLVNIFYKSAVEDGLKRLLKPAVLREIRGDYTENADQHGISVFAENLKNLLMQPPIKRTRVLGVDPGIRTGTKAAAVDNTGKFLGYFTFMQNRVESSKLAVLEAIKKYDIELVAVGNGTGSHDVQEIISQVISENSLKVQYTVVGEDGASVYSASDVAREEFPDLDLTIRGAISIARRLQDPLAELVKIDPKSIGVGLYQHDVNQTKLAGSLDETVESVVNNVGVDLNTASFSLLKYVSGITSRVAKKIVKYREEEGSIKTREELKKVSGFGERTFEQAAGFLKIPESTQPLDNTWVHPENYQVGAEILEHIQTGKKITAEVKKSLMAKYEIGETTISDLVDEIQKPNRDPRDDFPQPIMQKGVVTFEDLKVGMKVTGKVKNVVDFGAFVDVGIKETALLHISQMSDNYVKSPSDVVKVGDVKECTIIEIDTVRKRISLSLKSQTGGEQRSKAPKTAKKKKFDYSQYILRD